MRICGKDVTVTGRFLRIAHVEGDSYESLNDPPAMLDGLRRSGVPINLFTFVQIMPDTSPKYAYPFEGDNLAVLQVSTFDHWWTHQIGFKACNKAKPAEKKGITLREVPFDDHLVQGIWQIYNECPVRQGRPFSHYGKDFESVRRMSATFLETSIFLGAFLDDRLIGFAKLTVDQTGSQAGVMHILSLIQERDKAPNNALIAQAVRSCAERRISYLVYSNFTYGNKQRDSLRDFKESNGFRGVQVPRYYIPLTRVGALALRLGLHHSLLSQLPEPVLARLLDLRNAWYKRNFKAQIRTS